MQSQSAIIRPGQIYNEEGAIRVTGEWKDDDESLLERIAGRDEASLSLFYDRYQSLVYSLALRILGDPSAAEEAVLEVFMQVWQRSQDYRADRGKVITWLITIARSRAIDHRRKRIRREQWVQSIENEPSTREVSADPGENPFEAERKRQIRMTLNSLSEPQRKAIELAYFHGMSQSEIAEALNEPLGTIKSRLRSALMVLRAGLASYT